ncbi:MAG TPA: MBL fold metallo-hydrolase [Candidatus Ligilactobacillus excrementigallinarum]|uniref:MBL fold metallo-hydrolase n=1 Tax=Candidatus Ligilactobacillus excrementigallinarum TaxID=2838641 RepID=A0A9D2AAK7_9LACO|nr:MBL fold metallo-hydrolase [Candidatus Ligilactobacillus excrementigallinarum]
MELKDKTVVTYHRGVDTIGGTNIEISYGNSHIFFDLGIVFKPELNLENEHYDTLVKNHLIPKLSGFYDEQLPSAPSWNSDFKYSAAFVSHLHLDHTKMINYVDERLPIYATPETIKVLNAINEQQDFLLPAWEHSNNYIRPINQLKINQKISIGQIEVEFVPVDHDADGAVAFLIHTPDNFIAYTGDLRLHGFHPEWTRKFMEKAKNCDLLISEGVGVSFPNENRLEISSENDLVTNFCKIIKENIHSPITFNTYPGNLSRLIEICNQCPRKVVLSASRANLLKKVTGIQESYYYLPGEKRILDLNPENEVSLADLFEYPEKYVWQIEQQFELLKPGTIYIHSDAEPLGDFDPAYHTFIEKLEKQDVQMIRLTCSGHATSEELGEIIAGIKPQLLTPIHSFHPENLKNPFGKRLLVQNGQSLVLR